MEEEKKIRNPIRILVAIVSIPLWAGFVFTGWSLVLGDAYQFRISHVLAVVLAIYTVSIVGFGKLPLPLSGKRRS